MAGIVLHVRGRNHQRSWVITEVINHRRSVQTNAVAQPGVAPFTVKWRSQHRGPVLSALFTTTTVPPYQRHGNTGVHQRKTSSPVSSINNTNKRIKVYEHTNNGMPGNKRTARCGEGENKPTTNVVSGSTTTAVRPPAVRQARQVGTRHHKCPVIHHVVIIIQPGGGTGR